MVNSQPPLGFDREGTHRRCPVQLTVKKHHQEDEGLEESMIPMLFLVNQSASRKPPRVIHPRNLKVNIFDLL
jgi:hypothetical protein